MSEYEYKWTFFMVGMLLGVVLSSDIARNLFNGLFGTP